MRNYDREYVQKYCRELISTIVEFNAINGKKVINVKYGRILSGLQKGRFCGLDLECNLPNCGISRVVIEPMEDDKGYAFDAYDRECFTYAYAIDYQLGHQSLQIVDAYISKWMQRIDGLLHGKKYKCDYFTNDWHDEYYDTIKQLEQLSRESGDVKFEKIAIDHKMLQHLAKCICNAYDSKSDSAKVKSMQKALEKCVFLKKKQYIDGVWNSCDVDVPKKLAGANLIFRKKDTDCDRMRTACSDSSASYAHSTSYYVGGRDSTNKAFWLSPSYSHYAGIQWNINDNPQQWEFRVVPR